MPFRDFSWLFNEIRVTHGQAGHGIVHAVYIAVNAVLCSLDPGGLGTVFNHDQLFEVVVADVHDRHLGP